MTIANTGLRASLWQSLAGYIKQLERSCRRWQLYKLQQFYKAYCTLGMRLQVQHPRRSQNAPSFGLMISQIILCYVLKSGFAVFSNPLLYRPAFYRKVSYPYQFRFQFLQDFSSNKEKLLR